MAITIEDEYDIAGEEVGGLVDTMRRKIRVSGLTTTDPIDRIEEVFSSGVIPAAGSITLINSASQMVLRSRSLTCDSQSPSTGAIVSLGYKRIDGIFGSNGSAYPPKLVGSTSLIQVTTNFDKDGNDLEVEHTWDSNDTGIFPDGTPRKGKTETQNGQITYYYPTRNVTATILYEGNSPGGFQAGYVGKLNADTWQGGSPRTWMCFGGPFTPIAETLDPQLWLVEFAFAYNDRTWDDPNTIAFIDPNTGRPPVGLVDGVGKKTVEYYDETNFGTLI